eukprot:m.94612 g.94612  ORF g.94612 m.94612 type:complete len:282 (-) comp12273_c0_seq2:8-853(-)
MPTLPPSISVQVASIVGGAPSLAPTTPSPTPPLLGPIQSPASVSQETDGSNGSVTIGVGFLAVLLPAVVLVRRRYTFTRNNFQEDTTNFVLRPLLPDESLVVVASCPHTMSLDNLPPFHIVDNKRVFDVFEHCKYLQDAGDIRTAHDCAGSALTSAQDKDAIWSLNDPRLNTLSEREKWHAVKDSVSKSRWFACFQASNRSAIRQIALSHPRQPIRLICIQGGPITEVEHDYMSKIVTDGRRDAKIFGSTDIRITIDFCSYREFRNEFPSPPYLLRKSTSL